MVRLQNQILASVSESTKLIASESSYTSRSGQRFLFVNSYAVGDEGDFEAEVDIEREDSSNMWTG